MPRPKHGPLAAVFAGATLVLSLPAAAKERGVIISSEATKNMQCAFGVCVPTARNAVLNVRDLETMLESGSVEVTTTGTDVEAEDMDIDAPLAWEGTSTLTLDSYHAITITDAVVVKGMGSLELTINNGSEYGTLVFAKKGHVTFENLASSLVFNGQDYTLVGDIATLASDIAANPAGNFALAKNYDAAGDGTYSGAPVATTFSGFFEGLGNRISNLAIDAVLTPQSTSGYAVFSVTPDVPCGMSAS